MKRNIKLLEEFDDENIESLPNETQSSETQKPSGDEWIIKMASINDAVLEYKKRIAEVAEANEKLEKLKQELGIADLQSEVQRIIGDIGIAMNSISMSTHRVHGMLIKHKKGTTRYDPPGAKMILDLLMMHDAELKKVVDEISKATAYKTAVPVKSSTIIKPEEPETVTESEMPIKKPWYKRLGDSIMNTLRNLRSSIIKSSMKLDDIADKIEIALSK